MMKFINNTPNELKQQIEESIKEAIKTYREDYPNKKSCRIKRRTLKDSF